MARIAIIGAGLAGLGCAHFLHREHTLTVFEQNGYASEDANPANLAPIVFDRTTSPLLSRLLDQLEVPVKPIAASFSASDEATGAEWGHGSLNRIFAQRKNLLDLRFLKLLQTVRRFNREALASLDEPETGGQTVGDYVRRRGYGDDFFQRYLLPLGGTLWHTPPEFMLSFPAATLLRFFRDHGLLGLRTRERWWSVDDGAGSTMSRLTAPWRDRLRAGDRATRFVRTPRGVTVMTEKGVAHPFDHVVVATHADQALRLLVNPTPDEARLLGEFQYRRNTVVLHGDTSVMPRTRRAWAVWNCRLTRDTEGRLAIATHHWVNPSTTPAERPPLFVSINGSDAIDPAEVIESTSHEHPLFTVGTAQAQTELLELNTRARGRTETYFAGSYFGYGFKEDALRSAAQLAGLLLGRDPWE